MKDSDAVQRLARDLQHLAGEIASANVVALTEQLESSMMQLPARLTPIGMLAVQALTAQAVTAIHRAGSPSASALDSRLGEVWRASSPEALKSTVGHLLEGRGRSSHTSAHIDKRGVPGI